MPAYAELHCLSNFTFLRGASHPEELVARAAHLGYRALGLTDECSLAGVVRAHLAAQQHKLHLIIGSEFRLDDGLRLVLLATGRAGYGQLSSLITLARRNAAKGRYRLNRQQLAGHGLEACLALWLPGQSIDANELIWLAAHFPGRSWIAVHHLLRGDEAARWRRLRRLGAAHHVPLCAAGGVYMHCRSRRALQDTLTAIRLGIPLHALGGRLQANGERHLRPLETLARLYPPPLLAETVRIARRCRFSLAELRYEYPRELVPGGYTAHQWLAQLVAEGMRHRWPAGAPVQVRRSVARELALVKELRYEPYFLTVYDIVRFARSRGILCQGRGSAANSAICYCLGITAVDPGRMALLFERFISKERNEPPDIDVDFEHERREEVIQYIYQKYGRERAALAATVIRYRPRSAIRDVGRALGLSRDQIDRLAKSHRWWDDKPLLPQQLQALGFAAGSPVLKRLAVLVDTLIGFPRHLSQHVGGFVIAAGRLSELVPIENAAMAERTVIQWEKDDLEALGLLKVDVLALGMLSAIRKALHYLSAGRPRPLTLADIPPEDPAVYDMIQKADTIGVFQIESRAQMSMLPRLKPRCYYDLVIQIAIVRPGPIQGEMVHPYLARRSGREPVRYPSKEVEGVLSRTLGVPIFQEQVMQLAMVAAGFSAGEADQLRRAMAAWKRRGGLEKFERKLMQGMTARGYSAAFAQQIFRQIRGFGDYGFPESHAASFALLAYASAWLKHHHPAAFTCALLNSQPMGFYRPAQLVQDARRHGVEVLPVDVCHSEEDCTLVAPGPPAPLSRPPALRLGLCLVKGLSQAGMARIPRARRDCPFEHVQDLAGRARLSRADMEALAAADALKGLAGDRHRAHWQASGVEQPLPLFESPRFQEAAVLLRRPSEGEDIVADYAACGFSLRRHPLALLRSRLARHGIRTAAQLRSLPSGALTKAAGLVIGRQRPGTASGVIFVTLEDETGHVNVVVWAKVADAQRRVLLQSKLLLVSGTVQQEEGVLHLLAGRLQDLTALIGRLDIPARDFH
ncbi:MAG TPA: error-prone DNA polymerase [Gammaproteobacteria bacterium]|nr:error-prone DNA polymerase [Gammaproteobacteria bacterium]